MSFFSIAESVKYWRGHSHILACNKFNGVAGLHMPTDKQIKHWCVTTAHDFSALKACMLFFVEHVPVDF